MANPILKTCDKGKWTLVAEGVLSGQIWMLDVLAKYVHTYRRAGDAAPLDTDSEEGVPMFIRFYWEEISFDIPSDIYIFCHGNSGKVRVDVAG